MQTPGEIRIAKKYKSYRKALMSVWETYSFLQFAVSQVDNLIKKEQFPKFNLDHLSNSFNDKDYQRHFEKKDVLGITDRILKKTNQVRAFIDPVALTETYMQDLCEIVYKDFPERILGKDSNNQQLEQKESQIKLISLIVKSTSRDEILDTIIEEKIRGIFYGNPVDFYQKDKANIGIGDFFKNNHSKTINRLAEIIARRNIYVHNDGRVDSKYLREVENPIYALGKIATLSEEYVRENIFILRGFAATVTKRVVENTYKVTCKNSMIVENAYSFNKKYNI